MNLSIPNQQLSNPIQSNTTNADGLPPAPATHHTTQYGSPKTPSSHRLLSIITGHTESVSCIALCGEFIITASHGKEIMVWQQPDLRLFTKFGHGRGSVKSLIALGSLIFTAHQDSKIRVWRVSRNLENVFKLVDTLPTTKDFIGNYLMKNSSYVQTRRNHKSLWIEHADTISCLTVHNELIYSGSWDRTIKIWRLSDFKCLESIKAHDDAINVLTSSKGLVFSASADGKIKAWERVEECEEGGLHFLKGVVEGHKDVAINSVVVSGDCRVVYGGGSDGYVMGWLVEDWSKVFEVAAHKMSILCMCMKGEILCTGSTDKTIGIWKREDKGLTKVGVMIGHEGPIKCLQVSPTSIGDGFLVYSGGLDKSIRVWWVSNNSSMEVDLNSTIINTITSTALF